MPTKILVTGYKGRMGQCILQCASEDRDLKVIATLGKDDPLGDTFQTGVVVVDFSSHLATPIFAKQAEKSGCPMVIATTGFTAEEKKIIVSASKKVPIVMATNMSVGVNILFDFTHKLTSLLKENFDVEIIEKHHRHKKDAPSGTAITLSEMVADAKGLPASKIVKHGRSGDTGERTREEVGIHSIRGGDYVGEHTVIFAGNGETLEITHKASSREIFARGALRAAKWVASAKPGMYNMFDVLGIKRNSP